MPATCTGSALSPPPPPPQAYLNVEALKGVTRSITADDANQART
jgi:hypothetical protein